MKKEEKSMMYKGTEVSKSVLETLSPEMLQWLEYYQALPDEQKMMVNYEPKALKDVCGFGINTPATVHDVNGYNGTGQPVFNAAFWNANLLKANCYAHAMNVIVDVDGEQLQPGEILDVIIPVVGKDLLGAANVIKANSIADATSLMLDRKTNLRVCLVTDVPQNDEYMVALVVAPIPGTDLFYDYHWYKLDVSTGIWSHKPGPGFAVQTDALGYLINATNLPHVCNRNYNNGDLNYSHFVDYFMVTHN